MRFSGGSVRLLKSAAGDDPGNAACRLIAYSGGIMRPAGWGDVVIDLDDFDCSAVVPLLADHQNLLRSVAGFGQPTNNGKNIGLAGEVLREEEAGAQVIRLYKARVPLSCSVGATYGPLEFLRPGESIAINGRTLVAGDEGLTVVRGGVLKEISFTPIGGDPGAGVDQIQATGATNVAKHNDERFQGAEAVRQLERERLARIDSICERDGGWNENHAKVRELRASAIAGELSIDEFEKEMLPLIRGSRSLAPAAHIPAPTNVGADSPEVLEASLSLGMGVKEKFLGRFYSDRVMNMAMSREGRGASMHTVMRAVIRAAGKRVPDRAEEEFIQASFQANGLLQASVGGFSTYSLPGILGNAQNKVLLQAYQAVTTVWQKIAFAGSNKDFKQSVRYRLTGKGVVKVIGPGGELDNVSMDEQAYSTQLKTEGAILTATRQDIINDDLGALGSIPRILGRQCALAVEREFFVLLLSNPSNYFSLANRNYLKGNNAALNIDSLQAAWRLMTIQLDTNQQPVMITPATLLVAPTNMALARQLTRSTEVRVPNDSAQTDVYGTGNPWEGLLSPETSPWLDEATPGVNANDDAWYLFGSPSDIAPFEVTFLNGQSSPTIENANTNFDTLGLSWRCYFDFGLSAQDQRAGTFANPDDNS
jgi:hypothetical protein